MGHMVEELLHELSVLPLFSEHVGTFTLTNYTFFLLIAFTVTVVFFAVATRRISLVPKGIGNVVEAGVSFVRDGLCVDILGSENGRKYFPFIGTIFFFVLFNNLIGLVPGALPGTGTIGVTVTWGVIVFLVYNTIGIKKNGFFRYMKSFVPSGTPIFLMPLIFLLEIVSHFLRPITLGIRLYANMYAGHIMLGIFTILVAISLEHLSPGSAVTGGLAFAMRIVMHGFEVFVAVLQAYIFSILTTVYINGALHASEH
jgi:F-type H+-transporting ATPase subunit a